MRPVLQILLVVAATGCRDRARPAGDAPALPAPGAPTPPAPRSSASASPAAPGASQAGDTETAAGTAMAVLRDYYAALAARDYARAYAAWGPNGPPGRPSLARFRAGFAQTASVAAALGAPGRVEGAAGSRYLEVPVTVTATQRDGEVRRYRGRYTLRRAAVPEATPADRRWHLYAAALTRVDVPRAAAPRSRPAA